MITAIIYPAKKICSILFWAKPHGIVFAQWKTNWLKIELIERPGGAILERKKHRKEKKLLYNQIKIESA